MAAIVSLWIPLVSGLISTGISTVQQLQAAFNSAHSNLTPAEKAAAWQKIITHDHVRAAIAHAAAGTTPQS